MNAFVKTLLFTACVGAINLTSSIGTPANADVVTDWNNAALDAIRAQMAASRASQRFGRSS